MNNETLINREKYRALNVKINGIIKTTKQNEKAGYAQSEDHKKWLSELIAERDRLELLSK